MLCINIHVLPHLTIKKKKTKKQLLTWYGMIDLKDAQNLCTCYMTWHYVMLHDTVALTWRMGLKLTGSA